MTNIFEYATKVKLRFPFKGQLSVEDLWDLSVTNLDTIFKSLNAEKKQVQEESLLNIKTKENKELEVKIEIVKHIVEFKLQEADAKLKEKEKKEQKQKIMEILNTKQDESLKNKSVEELQEMLNEM